jgi:predicted Zn-ribbon and HTH transcriptional regulator
MLSARASVREKEIAEHLSHLSRSLKAQGEHLEVEPAQCLACGFRFKKRDKLTTPGACPVCRSERVQPPAFRII